MALADSGNDIIFILKQIGVSTEHRLSEDPRFTESFLCDELDKYIAKNPGCTLFETLRDEEAYSNVRVFFDVDSDIPIEQHDMIVALHGFIRIISKFVSKFAVEECLTVNSQKDIIRSMQSDFSISMSTDTAKTSFHILFINVYTTLGTLIAMKKPLIELTRRSTNPLVRAIDTAVFRRGASLRVVGTKKTATSRHVHMKTPPHTDISNYLFTFVDFTENSCYFSYRQRAIGIQHQWDKEMIPFADAMKKVVHIIGNEIINFTEITEHNFDQTPLIIDYVAPCAICKKQMHKHPHNIAFSNGTLRLFKSGNPNSCKLKIIPLEGNRLFTIAQRILEANVINLTDRGDYIVWLKTGWRFSGDESVITKLVLCMRDHLAPEFSLPLLCPRNRKTIENNLRDLLIESIETDAYPEKLPFSNGVMDISDGSFHEGEAAKDFICTVSTGYKLCTDTTEEKLTDVIEELENILNDIQPQTPANEANREMYERVLSSCLCGTTKPCITFFFGETATGKSTTKKLLRSALGGLFMETGQTILTDVMDKGPNPFIANMHLKRAVFCSELPDFSCNGVKKIRADNIKKLTESCLIGRQCYSNKISNRNHASIIIDTNYKPVFDKVDNALMRRVSMVLFRTHFSHKQLSANAHYDMVKKLDDSLDRKIQSNYYRYAFLHILVRWYQKHHLPLLKLDPTPELIPDFGFHREINDIIVQSNSTHVKFMKSLSTKGYVIVEESIALPAPLFVQRLSNHFNVRVFGNDIDSFVNKNKKYANIGEEYLEYIFIEDIVNK